MTDYIVYHKAELMGYSALDVENLAIYTNKDASGSTGGRVWLITGEGRPRKYFLRATFLIRSIEGSDKANFKHRITGTDGHLLDPMPLLNMEPWFVAFSKEQGSFGFGFNKIKNTLAQDGLRKLLLENTLR
jgi:hypothetical protein